MVISEVVELVKNSENTLLKYVSANDAGETKSHQAGFYIPKNAVSIFFDKPGVKGENKEQIIEIRWPEKTTESRVIYYGKGTRNEYRITRLNKKTKNNDLFVLIQNQEKDFLGFLFGEDQSKELLKELNISPSVVGKGYVVSKETFKSEELRHSANFKSRARLLPQLGDMLIKSEEVAFLELLKNSYDAGATEVTVLMDKINLPDQGIILIEDNGVGMDVNTVLNVWLELGSDYKLNQIDKIKSLPKSEKGRIPIGEKGIGRLGAHKLGNNIELISKKVNQNEVHVNINWEEFDEKINEDGSSEKKFIEDINIDVVEKAKPNHFTEDSASGTFIGISNLKFTWTRGKLRNIQRTITSISSPFQTVNEKFNVELKVLDKPGWLEDVITWDNIKNLALFNFKAVIKDNSIQELEYEFTPYDTFEKLESKSRSFNINNENEENDQLILSNKTLKGEGENGEEVSISLSSDEVGTIKIEGYVFDLESYILNNVFDKKGLKEYLRANSGVKVFRDGMRVYNYGEPDNDWLDLNLKRLNNPGENISNNIIVCGVFLDRENSLGLKEKTNREGFIENEHFKAFKEAVSQVIEVIGLLRKSDKKRMRDLYGPTKKSEPVLSSIGQLQVYVSNKVQDKAVAKEINSHLSEIEDKYKIMQDRLLRTSSAGLGLSIVLHEVEKVIKELYEIIKNDPSIIDNVLNLVKRLSKLIKGYSEMFSKSSVQTVSIEDLLEDSLFSIEFRLRKHEVSVIKKYQEKKNLKLRIAKGLIEGIIINIIDNSIYWLEIAKEEHNIIKNKKLYIDVIDNEKNIEIIFADNGTGFLIPTDQAIEPMETGKKVGLGLGLNIAHEIMLSQKGKLEFPDFKDYEIPNEFEKGALVSLNFKK